MKIIITGAAGFLGRETVFSALRRGFDIIAVFYKKEIPLPSNVRHVHMDLTNDADVQNLVLNEFPDAIINCAGITSIAETLANPERAEKINVAFPRMLAMLMHHLSGRFVHVSTDMVFDGEKGNYEHTDTPNPKNLYGQIKMLGDREVLRFGKSNATVVRTTLLSGNSLNGSKSLHERLFSDWINGKQTALFEEEFRQPVSVSNLADALVELCERPNLSGVYHWSGEESLSRYEIGVRIAQHFGLSAKQFIRKTNYNDAGEAAKDRPRDLSFVLYPLSGKLKTRVQNFEEILAEMNVPFGCEAWFKEQTGRDVVRKLVKGRDF